MRVPGRKFLRRLLRPLATRVFPGAAVLGYHRIADVTWDPLGLAVGTARFREQLAVLSDRREVVGLGELVRRSLAGEPVERCAVITFDDGYRDFVDNAVPNLRQAGMPATVFVATGFTGGQFWWEQLAMLLTPGRGSRNPLAIDDGSGYSRSFRNLDDPVLASRAVGTIGHDLRAGDPAQVTAVLDQVRAWASDQGGDYRQGQPLTRDQLVALDSNPLVDIGAHTVGHGCLGDMEEHEQRAEIGRSRRELESIVSRPVKSFSYPNGSYSEETPGLVEQAGFECACASTEGLHRASGDRFRIPRLWVPDIGGREFEAWLSAWIGRGR